MKAGYKQTEVGVIPEDLGIKKVGNICDFIVLGRNKPKVFNGDICWVTTPDLQGKFAVYDSNLKITKEIAKSVGSKIVPKNSVIMTCVGDLGIVAIAGVEMVINQQLHAFLPNDNIDFIYLYFALSNQKKYMEEIATKTAVPYMNKTNCNSIPIPIPPTKAEQAAIATALSDVDALISALDNLIAKKRLIKQGAMQELLSGKKRLAGFSEDWEVKTFGEIFDFLTTATYSRADLSESDDIYYGDIHTKWDYFLDFEKSNLPTIKNEQVKKYPFIKDGDIIMADASEDYDGICKSVEVKNIGSKKAISGLHTFLLRDNKGVFENGFKAYIQANMFVKNQNNSLATGLKVYGVSKVNLKTIKIFIPPKKEQTAIAQILSDMDTDILALETQRNKTLSLKQGMMQELLTGKTRLINPTHLGK